VTRARRNTSGPFVLADRGVDATSVTLRLFGDDLDPDAVSQRLGSTPTLARRKGDSIPDGKRVAETGSWLLSSERQSKNTLEHQIEALFTRLSDDMAVWRDLADSYHVDLFCGLWSNEWNRGLELSPKIVAAIAERGLRVGFDIYFVEQ
jgi:hypothetical protein